MESDLFVRDVPNPARAEQISPCGGERIVSRLTTRRRDKLPRKDFALPERIHKGKRGAKITRGAYPIENHRHAVDALARAAHDETRRTYLKIARRVKKRFPKMHIAALEKK